MEALRARPEGRALKSGEASWRRSQTISGVKSACEMSLTW